MNLFELFVKVGVDDQASDKLSNLSKKLGNGLKTAAKIGTAAVATAAAGITALTTAAVNNYAEYEQLVGGVDTLFKEASQKVQQYASEAFRTAGMSANDYMSTVTSFSASLLQSLGGDTDKAAEYANQALIDMSDNANKMGTDMQLIQNAYQGFAKANYTMLDNLKLGYGGTKTEMERLIKDAAKLDKSVKANDLSFGNIVKAINVVQTEMGITGTTAKEAGATISGSVGAMKAAWQNLLTGLANGNADIGGLIDNLVTTIVGDGTESNLGVLGNILPAVERALEGVAKLIEVGVPKIVENLPGILMKVVPSLISAAKKMVVSIFNGIRQNSKTILNGAMSLVLDLANGVAENLPSIISGIVDVVLELVDILTDPENLSKLLDAAIKIVTALVDGLAEALPRLATAAVILINGLLTFLLQPENIQKIIKTAVEVILTLASGLIQAIPQLVAAIPELISAIFQAFAETDWGKIGVAIVNGIWEGVKSLWGEMTGWIRDGIGFLSESIRNAFNATGDFFGTVDKYLDAKQQAEMDVAKAQLEEMGIATPETSITKPIDFAGSPTDRYRKNSTVIVNQNIYSQPKSAADLMAEALYQQQKAVLLGG